MASDGVALSGEPQIAGGGATANAPQEEQPQPKGTTAPKMKTISYFKLYSYVFPASGLTTFPNASCLTALRLI
jgi:hypothetical protein